MMLLLKKKCLGKDDLLKGKMCLGLMSFVSFIVKILYEVGEDVFMMLLLDFIT